MGNLKAHTAQQLLLIYLKSYDALGQDIAPEVLVELNNRAEFQKALEWIEYHYAGYLPLDAIASQTVQNLQEYAKERAQLLEVLRETIPYTKAQNSIGDFDERKARQLLYPQTQQLRPLTALQLHAQRSNLSIQAKLLTGQLHGYEWLIDVDLRQLCERLGFANGEVTITRLNSVDLGMALHFAREQQTNDQPYQIPLLLNLGSSGSAQGHHWVYALVSVNPCNNSIELRCRDSGSMTSQKRDRIQSIFQQALEYQEISNNAGHETVFSAFPNYHLQHVSIESNGKQQPGDGHRCGYYALQSLVEDARLHLADNAERTQLRQADTPEMITQFVYNTLTQGMTVANELLQAEPVAIADKFNKGDQQAILDESCVSDLVALSIRRKPNILRPSQLSKEEIEQQIQLEKQVSQHYVEFKQQQKRLISQTEDKLVLTVDNQDFDQAKMIALSRLANEAAVTELNFSVVPEQSLETFTSIISILVDNDTAEDLTLQRICMRNQLLSICGTEVDPEQNVWSQYWHQRLTNSDLFLDQYGINKNTVAIDYDVISSSNPPTAQQVNGLIENDHDYLFERLLDYLASINSKHIISPPFGQNKLELAGRSSDKPAVSIQLNALTEHLAKGAYLPFDTLTIDLGDGSVDDKFEQLLALLAQTPQYPQLKTIQFSIHNNQQSETFSEAQANTLCAQIESQGITVMLQMAMCFKDKKLEKQVINTGNIVRRQLNIAKRQTAAVDTAESADEEVNETPAIVISGKPRAIKSGDIKSMLNIEVTAEQQQETQTSTQVEQKANQKRVAGDDDATDDLTDSDAIKRKEYATRADCDENDESNDVFIRNMEQLLPMHRYPAVMKTLDHYWQDFFGRSNHSSSQIHYVSHDALRQLLKNDQMFLEGIDIGNLPAGFSIKFYDGRTPSEDTSGLMLDYSADQASIEAPRNPLTLILQQEKHHIRLQGDMRQFVTSASPEDIDSTPINQHDDRSPTYHTLKIFMDGVNLERSKRILMENHWCLINHSDEDAYEQYFNNGHNIYALIDILYHEGCEGIDTLMCALQKLYDRDPILYRAFKRAFIDSAAEENYSIMRLLDPKNLAAIDAICALPNTQLSWWVTLSQQHGQHIPYAQPYECLAALQYFFKQIPDTIELPYQCPIQQTSNMQVSLSRLLKILQKVPAEYLPDQMHYLAQLDYSADGAALAAQREGFHFFHPAMALNTRFCDNDIYIQALVGNNLLKMSNPLDSLIVLSVLHSHLSNNQQPSDVAVFLHRYYGGCKEHHPQYEKYVTLVNQLLPVDIAAYPYPNSNEHGIHYVLMPCIAAATSGRRGQYDLNIDPLLEFVEGVAVTEDQADQVRLSILAIDYCLTELKFSLNLKEMTALVKLFTQSSIKHQSNMLNIQDYFQMFNEKISEKTLGAIIKWSQLYDQDSNLSAMQFINAYYAAQQFDQEHINELSHVIAALCHTEFDQDTVLQALEQLKANHLSHYETLIELLSTIDVTASGQLPTVKNITTIVDQMMADANADVEALVRAQLPTCQFNIAGAKPVSFFNIQVARLHQLKELNGIIEEHLHLINFFDFAKLTPEKLCDYLQQRLTIIDKIGLGKELTEEELASIQLDNCTPDELKKLAKPLVWGGSKLPPIPGVKDLLVYGHVYEFLENVTRTDLMAVLSQFPALDTFEKTLFKNKSAKTKKYDRLIEDFENLQQQATRLYGYFKILNELHSQDKWGDSFDITLLINSPLTAALITQNDDLLSLLDALCEIQGLKQAPEQLLKALFDQNPLQQAIVLRDIEAIIELLKCDDLTFNNRQRIICQHILRTNTDTPSILRERVALYRRFPRDQPNLFKALVKLSEHANSVDQLNTIGRFCTISRQHANVAIIIATKLRSNLPQLELICDVVERSIQANTLLALLSKIDLNDSQADVLINRLATLANDPETANNFASLSTLFDEKPYPTTELLNGLLELQGDALQDRLAQFEYDPAGKRLSHGVLEQQFDMQTAIARIDQIENLSEQRHLYASQKQTLLDRLTYINAVGNELPLSQPKEQALRIPVRQHGKKQIQMLISQYHAALREPNLNASTREILLLEFIAIAREAMYRSTGSAGLFAYSTQLLAILSSVFQPGNCFSEIRTGEGKSLMTAITAACLWAEGGPVDICSSDLSYAARDFKDNQDFFAYMGIAASLIDKDSAQEDYQMDGINYSDIANRSLFHQGVIVDQGEVPLAASCILDEADFATLDETTLFRLARNANNGSNDNPNAWVYPIILSFVQQPEFLALDARGRLCSKEQDIENLRQYAEQELVGRGTLAAQFSQLVAKHRKQVDRWIDSAYIATKLVKDEDYVIRHIQDESGTVIAREARVKTHHRERQGSTYSDGVHQFLHTLLNQRLPNGEPFIVKPETTYLSSENSKTFLQLYNNGRLLGLSGTMGSEEERAELAQDYGIQFYRIPPHKPLRRNPTQTIVTKARTRNPFRRRPFTAVEHQTAHLEAIATVLAERQQMNQPTLVINDSVDSCDGLTTFLQQHAQRKGIDLAKLQRFDGEQQDLSQDEAVTRAGQPGMITVSTPMLGRATDIKPVDRDLGIAVLLTYIAKDSDEQQTIGRGGRNGDAGDAFILISQNEIDQHAARLGQNANVSDIIQYAKDKIALNNAKQRHERKLFSHIKQQFIGRYYVLAKSLKAQLEVFATEVKLDYRPLWKQIQRDNFDVWNEFLVDVDQCWNELLNDARAEQRGNELLDKHTARIDQKAKLLIKHCSKTWDNFIARLSSNAKQAFQEQDQESPEINFKQASSHDLNFSAELEQKAEPANEPVVDISRSSPLQKTTVEVYHQHNKDVSLLSEEQWQVAVDHLFEQTDIMSAGPGTTQADPARKLKAIIQSYLCYHFSSDSFYPDQVTQEQYERCLALAELVPTDDARQSIFQTIVMMTRLLLDQNAPEQYHQAGRGKQLQQLLAEFQRVKHLLAPNSETLRDLDEGTIWQHVYQYAMSQLTCYGGMLYKSRDRKRLLAELKAQLRATHTALNLNTSERITQLLGFINIASTHALESDTAHDQRHDGRSIWSFRNSKHNRFQDTLDSIRAFAQAYDVTTQSENRVANAIDGDLDKIKADINNLLGRRLKLRNTKSKSVEWNTLLNHLQHDPTLHQWSNEMTAGQHYLKLSQLKLTLEYYLYRFNQLPSSQLTQNNRAMLNLLNSNLTRVDTVLRAMEHHEDYQNQVQSDEVNLCIAVNRTLLFSAYDSISSDAMLTEIERLVRKRLGSEWTLNRTAIDAAEENSEEHKQQYYISTDKETRIITLQPASAMETFTISAANEIDNSIRQVTPTEQVAPRKQQTTQRLDYANLPYVSIIAKKKRDEVTPATTNTTDLVM